MKIQCDVCNKEEASVFCSADEAALCDSCDRRVHHANKLAEKHTRFSLIHPSSKESPCCDICQERRAFLFCKEDRSILCRECDVSIHRANEHTQKHNRFLLTGVKLSASSSLYPTASSGPSNGCNITFTNPEICNPPPDVYDHHHYHHHMSDTSSVSTSSISEYLETLPGWHVEDFLDPSPNSFGPCKIMDQDLDCSMTSFSSKAIWVRQFQPSSPNPPRRLSQHKEGKNTKLTRKFVDGFLSVPQISLPFVKKSRQI